MLKRLAIWICDLAATAWNMLCVLGALVALPWDVLWAMQSTCRSGQRAMVLDSRGEPPRSGRWRLVRRLHLLQEPKCQWCGGRQAVEVHHIEPFHLVPAKELDDANLITLCEKPGESCHLEHGHLRDWKMFNPNIRPECRERQVQSCGQS